MIGTGQINDYHQIGRFSMQKVILNKTKLITKAFYIPQKASLILTLKNGKTYSFYGVDFLLVDQFQKSKKPSKFFKNKIKCTYFAKKVKGNA